jgi:hypothetical protein
MKVTDRRIFTSEGELRDEFRFLEDRPEEPPQAATDGSAAAGGAAGSPGEEAPRASAAAQPSGGAAATATAVQPEPARPEDRPPGWPGAGGEPAEPGAPPLEIPSTPDELGAPGFYDLIAVLAEPVALYMGDAELPDGGSVENLDMARVHIDLLDVLRRKTAGNLSAQEAATLEDVLYRLRMRYVQKRG